MKFSLLVALAFAAPIVDVSGQRKPTPSVQTPLNDATMASVAGQQIEPKDIVQDAKLPTAPCIPIKYSSASYEDRPVPCESNEKKEPVTPGSEVSAKVAITI